MLHPIFHDIFAAPGMPDQHRPQLFKANAARQRSFLSQRDADDYDRGAARFPERLDLELLATPFGSGWNDAAEEFNPRNWEHAA